MNLSQSQNRNLGHGRGMKTCELNLSQIQNRNLGHGRGGRTCELNLSQSQNRKLGHGRSRKTCMQDTFARATRTRPRQPAGQARRATIGYLVYNRKTCELNLSQSQNRNLGHGRGRKTCELNLSQSQDRN